MKDNYKCWKVTVRSSDCQIVGTNVFKFPIFIRDADSKNGYDVCVQDFIISFWKETIAIGNPATYTLAPSPANLDIVELLSNTLMYSSSYETRLGGLNKTLGLIAISNNTNIGPVIPVSLDSGIFQQWGGENWVTVQNINGVQEIYLKDGQHENLPITADSNVVRFYLTLKIREHQPEKY